jgi:hypothetical protein
LVIWVTINSYGDPMVSPLNPFIYLLSILLGSPRQGNIGKIAIMRELIFFYYKNNLNAIYIKNKKYSLIEKTAMGKMVTHVTQMAYLL